MIARHYDQAGLAAQAIAHYQRAGERATQRTANEEAIGHPRRALDLVATLPETRERHQLEIGLQMAIAAPLAAARGFLHPEYEQTYARARELASRIGESPELPRALVGMADAYLAKGDLATSAEVAHEALVAAGRTGEAFDVLSAHFQVAPPMLYQGQFVRALQRLEQSIRLHKPNEHRSLAYTVGFDRGVSAHAYAAGCHMYLGHPDRALASSEAAVALAERVEHPLSLDAKALLEKLGWIVYCSKVARGRPDCRMRTRQTRSSAASAVRPSATLRPRRSHLHPTLNLNWPPGCPA